MELSSDIARNVIRLVRHSIPNRPFTPAGGNGSDFGCSGTGLFSTFRCMGNIDLESEVPEMEMGTGNGGSSYFPHTSPTPSANQRVLMTFCRV